MNRPLLFAPLALLLLAGCAGAVQQNGEVEPNYLRLASYVSIDADAGALEGFVRWIYEADDPSVFDEPRSYCEVWEYLELEAVEPDPACAECTDQYEGTATLEGEPDTTCEDVSWSPRDFTLAFGPLGLIDDPDRTTLEEEGYDFSVQTRWSPDLGVSEGFQALFAATPEQWAPDAGEAGSTDSIDGQYRLFSRFYWDVREADVP
jgi:hypothetical protein